MPKKHLEIAGQPGIHLKIIPGNTDFGVRNVDFIACLTFLTKVILYGSMLRGLPNNENNTEEKPLTLPDKYFWGELRICILED
jgi:hypothetical protein